MADRFTRKDIDAILAHAEALEQLEHRLGIRVRDASLTSLVPEAGLDRDIARETLHELAATYKIDRKLVDRVLQQHYSSRTAQVGALQTFDAKPSQGLIWNTYRERLLEVLQAALPSTVIWNPKIEIGCYMRDSGPHLLAFDTTRQISQRDFLLFWRRHSVQIREATLAMFYFRDSRNINLRDPRFRADNLDISLYDPRFLAIAGDELQRLNEEHKHWIGDIRVSYAYGNTGLARQL